MTNFTDHDLGMLQSLRQSLDTIHYATNAKKMRKADKNAQLATIRERIDALDKAIMLLGPMTEEAQATA